MLANIIATEGAPLSATETIAVAQEEAGSLATLVPRYQHAAAHAASRRYEDAAAEALGGPAGPQVDLQADPAWPQVALRLQDAEAHGWDPAQLLAVVAAQRELGSADSIAEVLAWRIDGYLADNPTPPLPGRPYETAATARERLALVAAAALGPGMSARTQAETAWPALIATLHRAENAGHDAQEILASVASQRELRTARSISEVLAWRIGRYLTTRPEAEARHAKTPPAEEILPWLASPGPSPAADAVGTGIARYLEEAADLISTRVDDLASVAVRHRPPWILSLGLPPQDPDIERQWLRHVAIVASYREQFKVTADDPHQVLGPYPESGQPAHKPYWHAAESVLAARRLAGLDPTAATTTLDDQARAQLAADIYRTLPESERAAISTEMATRLGPFWFGDPVAPDEEDAAAQSVHAMILTDTLAKRGHLTSILPSDPAPIMQDEPLEASLARRSTTRRGRQADGHMSDAPAPAQRLQRPPRHDATATPAPRPRLG